MTGSRAFGIVGWSGSGKTTLILALIAHFRARGVTVSTIKHAHHHMALDTPGKDSARHAAAGAAEVILATDAGFALFSTRPAPLAALLARLAPVDLVLIEGFGGEAVPKLAVHRPALGKPPLWPDPDIAAVASDVALAGCPVPVFALADVPAIADFIFPSVGLNRRRSR